MTKFSSVLVKSSRYAAGGSTEVGDKLEWWNRTNYTLTGTESVFTITDKYQGRLDLIAYDLYQDSSMWWIIAMLNNILDPFTEIVVGRELYVPTKQNAIKMMGAKIGGIQSQKELPPMQITPRV